MRGERVSITVEPLRESSGPINPYEASVSFAITSDIYRYIGNSTTARKDSAKDLLQYRRQQNLTHEKMFLIAKKD